MKELDQIKALAELDGYKLYFKNNEDENWVKPDGDIITIWTTANNKESLPAYLTSYDTIIPVRIKTINTTALRVKWLNTAREVLTRRIGKLVSDYDIASMTTAEECEVLLRAIEKWRDG